jgi:hypothetical protein
MRRTGWLLVMPETRGEMCRFLLREATAFAASHLRGYATTRLRAVRQ